jgi:SAM-dependent methyltransferase
MKTLKPGKDFTYNGQVARWWLHRALDDAHHRAYRKIADFIRESYVNDPKLIVDYACGAGNLLLYLGEKFPNSRLTGLDGSSFLLDQARRLLFPRISDQRLKLIETSLPNMNLMRGRADLAIYCFPNMAFPPRSELLLSENDRKIARSLSLDESDVDAKAVQSGLAQGRVVSLNLRRLLSRGGICIRVEYATIQRHDLSPEELTLVSFEEGSLDEKINGMRPQLWFRVLASSYFRSRVLEDVYEQTADERDRNGGYLITVLKAI